MVPSRSNIMASRAETGGRPETGDETEAEIRRKRGTIAIEATNISKSERYIIDGGGEIDVLWVCVARGRGD